jgi:hypothetical protein
VKLTDTQQRWLQWLHDNGGRCYPYRQCLAIDPDKGVKTNTGAAISFCNLAAKGLIEGQNGYLVITAYGRRQLGIREELPPHVHSWDGDQCHYCHIPKSLAESQP